MGEVNSVLQLIFLRKVNFLQVYNKLEVSRTFYKFSRNFYLFATAKPVLRSSQSTQWKVQLKRSVSRVSCIFFKLFHSLFKDCVVFSTFSLRFGLFTESWEEKHFKTLLILELLWIFNHMLYSLSAACGSKYSICISWKRPGSARFRVPRRQVPVWYLPGWAFCTKLAIRLPVPVFPAIQVNLQLVPARNLILCCICLEVTCLHKVQSLKMPRTTKPAKASTSAAEKVQDESSTHEVFKLRPRTRPRSLSPTISGTNTPQYVHVLHWRS